MTCRTARSHFSVQFTLLNGIELLIIPTKCMPVPPPPDLINSDEEGSRDLAANDATADPVWLCVVERMLTEN